MTITIRTAVAGRPPGKLIKPGGGKWFVVEYKRKTYSLDSGYGMAYILEYYPYGVGTHYEDDEAAHADAEARANDLFDEGACESVVVRKCSVAASKTVFKLKKP